MANVPQQPTTPTYGTLDFIDDTPTTLKSLPVLLPNNVQKRNSSPLQPYGAETQSAQGDGTLILGSHSADVLLLAKDGDVYKQLAALDTALKTTVKLTMSTPGGTSVSLTVDAAWLDKLQPTGTGLRVTVAYIPTESAAKDSSDNEYMGLL